MKKFIKNLFSVNFKTADHVTYEYNYHTQHKWFEKIGRNPDWRVVMPNYIYICMYLCTYKPFVCLSREECQSCLELFAVRAFISVRQICFTFYAICQKSEQTFFSIQDNISRHRPELFAFYMYPSKRRPQLLNNFVYSWCNIVNSVLTYQTWHYGWNPRPETSKQNDIRITISSQQISGENSENNIILPWKVSQKICRSEDITTYVMWEDRL